MSQAEPRSGPSRGLIALMAAACGAIVANLYYAQPLIALIGPELGLSESAASLVVTVSQLGYALGLVLLVPLGDQLENRALVVGTAAAGALALALAGLSGSGTAFLVASFVVGVTSTSVQMMIPIAASLADEKRRGEVVGTMMSGLLLGILLARPAASFAAHHLGWRAVFFAAAGLEAVLVLLLWRSLPRRMPTPSGGYGQLVASLWPILRDTPILRWRALLQGCLFGSFTLFWTAVPLQLSGPTFGLSQDAIGLFALCGVAGAAVAPFVGRAADRGFGRAMSWAAIGLTLAAFMAACLGAGSILVLALAAVILDAGVQMNQVVAQRVIYGLSDAMRNRMNGLYMALFFIGGAIGSALVSPVFVQAGWHGIAATGIAAALLASVAFSLAPRRER